MGNSYLTRTTAQILLQINIFAALHKDNSTDSITSERIRSALLLLRKVLGQDFWGAINSEPMSERDVKREYNNLNAALRKAKKKHKTEEEEEEEEEIDQTMLGRACALKWLAGESVKGYID